MNCPYSQLPHDMHEWGPALRPNYCPGIRPAPVDAGPWLIAAGILFAIAMILPMF